jgi:hypothetical protein
VWWIFDPVAPATRAVSVDTSLFLVMNNAHELTFGQLMLQANPTIAVPDACADIEHLGLRINMIKLKSFTRTANDATSPKKVNCPDLGPFAPVGFPVAHPWHFTPYRRVLDAAVGEV